MKRISIAQQRLLDNATLIAALKLVFISLERAGFPLRKLEEIADTTSGGTPDRSRSEYYGGDIPWIKSGELNDSIIRNCEEYLTEDGLQNSSAKIYPKDTLVVALYGATVGKTGILAFDAASNQAVCAIFPKWNDVSKDFIFWYLRYKRPEFLQSSFGAAQPNISQKVLRSTTLPIPPIALQKLICSYLEIIESRQIGAKHGELPFLPEPLSHINATITKIEELAAKIEEARGLRREGVEASDILFISVIDSALSSNQWKKFPIGELLRENSQNGLSAFPSNTPPGIPILRISSATSRDDAIIDEKDYKYVELDDYDYKKYKVEYDDILVCRFNGNLSNVGKFALYKNNSGLTHVYPDKLIRLRVDTKKVIPQFVCLAANSFEGRKAIESFCATTAGNIGISASNLKSVLIPIPSLSEQENIINELDTLHSYRIGLKQEQAKTSAELDALLPSILDKAFKGEL